jgi:4-amino-4-deoxy-L-arabinose transferase-like glycosyltransferase
MRLPSDAVELRGPLPRWRPAEWALLLGLTLAAMALRGYQLGAEGFADDEIHKWLAALRYLHGDFGGDDVEHPMMMKAGIAVAAALLRTHFSPEALTRLPNVFFGALTVLAIAQLGKRLFGKPAALIGATLFALSATAVGYGRIAKEDTPFTLFLTLLFWCLAEAMAAADDARTQDQARWELGIAVNMGAMLAAKYQIFILPGLPLLYLWLRQGSTAWRVPFRRQVQLVGVGIGVLLLLDWVILLPSSWQYLWTFVQGNPNGDRATSESYWFMGKLWDNLGAHVRTAPPFWFHLLFAAIKLSVPSASLVAIGLVIALWRRAPAHKIVLLWVGFLLLVYFVMAVKYGRYFIPLFPPLVLLAGHAAREGLRTPALVAAGLLIAVPETFATVSHAPHARLYLNALGGGDARIDYFFPHCDYFDAGLREAILAIARQAEPGAEISAEPGWVVRYYADTLGRQDIVETTIRPAVACVHHRVCYVIDQTGRLYWHNQAALERLEQTRPWTTVDVGGHQVIRVYRLEPGAALFPSASPG